MRPMTIKACCKCGGTTLSNEVLGPTDRVICKRCASKPKKELPQGQEAQVIQLFGGKDA